MGPIAIPIYPSPLGRPPPGGGAHATPDFLASCAPTDWIEGVTDHTCFMMQVGADIGQAIGSLIRGPLEAP